MKSFFLFLTKTLTYPVFFIFIVLSFLLFQLLNPEFYVSTWQEKESYKYSEIGFKNMLKESLEKDYEENFGSLTNLTVGQRKILDTEIKKVTDIITQEIVKDFSEVNIKRSLDFINGKNDTLSVYFPADKWGVPEDIMDSEIKDNLTENTEISVFLKNDGQLPVSSEQIKSLFNYRQNIFNIWIVAVSLLPFLFLLHYFLAQKNNKAASIGKTILTLGLINLFLSFVVKTISQNILDRLSYLVEPPQLLLAAYLAPVMVKVGTVWLYVSGFIFITGVLILSFDSMLKKRFENIQVMKSRSMKKLAQQPQTM